MTTFATVGNVEWQWLFYYIPLFYQQAAVDDLQFEISVFEHYWNKES
jgi:hypothetical protein